MPYGYKQSRISRTPYPQLGGGMLPQGPKIQTPHHLATQKNFDPPNWNMKHWKSVKLGDHLKEKHLYITVNLGPFESKVFTHCNCCWEPLRKQSNLLIRYSCCWAPLKARHFTHYSCYWRPLWRQNT